MEHLALEIFDLSGSGSQYATLDGNTAITIIDTSEIFSSGDVWSYSFSLNVPANAHIFGTAGEMRGSRLHEQINKRRARLWAEGLPLYTGYLKLGDEVDVDSDGNIDVSFESGKKTFEELIEGAKANQVPMMSDVRIGMALWQKRWAHANLILNASVTLGDGRVVESTLKHEMDPTVIGEVDPEVIPFSEDGESDGNSIQQYPRMVFPKGVFWNVNQTGEETVNCLNTDYPYDDSHPYCNIALCYQKYGYERRKEENGYTSIYSDYSSEPEAQRGYEVMPANRVNSAPNFFVIYWLRSLMKYLDIHIEENQMMDMEDLRRLFFVNTKCAYKKPKYMRDGRYDLTYGKYRSRADGSIVPEYFGRIKDNGDYNGPERISQVADCGFICTDYQAGEWSEPWGDTIYEPPTIDHIDIRVRNVCSMPTDVKQFYEDKNRYFHEAIATSDCFPNVDVSEVIKALENGFGIRFLFSDNYQRVRIVLLRNIFRSEEVQEVECEVLSVRKQENCIRGFRMTYGKTEDTAFYYKGFADLLPHKTELWKDDSDEHDYSKWDTNAQYAKLIHKVSAFDTTCYVAPATGNAYGIKVDKDAKRYDELHPSLFEYAGFMDAEDGDCTGEENTIETINVGFVPAVMNDVNFEQERDSGTREQRFALFVEEQMRARRPDLNDLPSDSQPGVKSYNDADAVYSMEKLYADDSPASKMRSDDIVRPGEFSIKSDFYAARGGLSTTVTAWVTDPRDRDRMGQISCHITGISIEGHISEGYRLYLQDNFEPNDDGISPIENHDWGLTLGIMRGSGSDAYVNYEADPDDGEGNDTWNIVAGSNTVAHPDTCDSYGNEWDYNGVQPGVSGNNAISTPAQATEALDELFESSNAPFYDNYEGYLRNVSIWTVIDDSGKPHYTLFATAYSYSGTGNRKPANIQKYCNWLRGHNAATIMQMDTVGYYGLRNLIVELDSNYGRASTLLKLCRIAYAGSREVVYLDNGISSSYGRFSLKLRAEKLNPEFDGTQPEGENNRRYLQISNKDLRGRGIMDTLYKEYSFWVRNARISIQEVRMELAQLLAIDKTKKVTIGDITGFIKKMEYSIDIQTGLSNVTFEIMYI